MQKLSCLGVGLSGLSVDSATRPPRLDSNRDAVESSEPLTAGCPLIARLRSTKRRLGRVRDVGVEVSNVRHAPLRFRQQLRDQASVAA